MANKTCKFWADRAVSHWKKENGFAFWKNLTPFQRRVLTQDIKQHLINMFELGRQSMTEDIKELLKNK